MISLKKIIKPIYPKKHPDMYLIKLSDQFEQYSTRYADRQSKIDQRYIYTFTITLCIGS